MNYFLDQEFHERFTNPLFGRSHHIIELISIGIVAEDGREYYAISKDFDINAAWNDIWIRENVLHKIHVNLVGSVNRVIAFCPFTLFNFKMLIKNHGKSNKQIAEEIQNFTNPYSVEYLSELSKQLPYTSISTLVEAHNINWMDSKPYTQPTFFGYYCDYDWVLFCSLFGKMINLPKGYPMYCIDLVQTMKELGLTKEWKEKMNPDPIEEHHALVDARWICNLHHQLKEYLKKEGFRHLANRLVL